MALTTVYFKGGDGRPYRKCLVDTLDTEFFMGLGAVETQAEAEVDVAPEDEGADDFLAADEDGEADNRRAGDGDSGWGRLGSKLWHRRQIESFTKTIQLYKYMREAFGEKAFPFVFAEKKAVTFKRALAFIEGLDANDD